MLSKFTTGMEQLGGIMMFSGTPQSMVVGGMLIILSKVGEHFTKINEEARKLAEEGFKKIEKSIENIGVLSGKVTLERLSEELKTHNDELAEIKDWWEHGQRSAERYFEQVQKETKSATELALAQNEILRQNALEKPIGKNVGRKAEDERARQAQVAARTVYREPAPMNAHTSAFLQGALDAAMDAIFSASGINGLDHEIASARRRLTTRHRHLLETEGWII